MRTDDEGYVLRPHDAQELDRLDRQHRVWKTDTDRVMAHAGFRAGDRIVDLGCGPGFLDLELAKTVGPEGQVLAVDGSPFFLDHLRHVAGEELPWIQTRCADLDNLELEAAGFDGAVCRWTLMYLRNPEETLRSVGRALRPGARFVVMEYFQFGTAALWPEGRHFEAIHGATRNLIVSRGGDPDVGSRVPAMLDDAGCDVVELVPILQVGRPGSAVWEWMEAATRNHGALVAENLLPAPDLAAFEREWQAQAALPHAFVGAPPVLATIGCKR